MHELIPRLEQIISGYESGRAVIDELEALYRETDLLDEWMREAGDRGDLMCIAHQSDVFHTAEDPEWHFELEQVRALGRDDVVTFVLDQIEHCLGGEPESVHWRVLGNSLVYCFGTPSGMDGIRLSDFGICRNPKDLMIDLLKDGYLFLPNEHYEIPNETLRAKFQQLLLARIDQ